MEPLPDELILHIISFLKPLDVLPLSLVSRRFFKLSRDNKLWKSLSHEGSSELSRIAEEATDRRLRTTGLLYGVNRREIRKRNRETPRAPHNDGDSGEKPLSPATWRSTQEVNWYNEFVARHSQLSLSWLPSRSDVRGIGILRKDGLSILVTPTEYGTIYLRSLGNATGEPEGHTGRIMACGNPSSQEGHNQSQHTTSGSDAIDCVSIDQFDQKMFFAEGSVLTQIDLNTLQEVSKQSFPVPIWTLSEGGVHPEPLTVGTTKSVHIYDPRDSSERSSLPSVTRIIEGLTQDERHSDLRHFYDHMEASGVVASIEPLPLSIAHASNGIYVAGRFPGILGYDRRFFPQKLRMFYSGSCISALLPFTSRDSKKTLVAAGEYKGRGSLELYPLSAIDDFSETLPDPVRNRTTAAGSMLLSAIRHGTRILFSDSNGMLKWVEQDGSSYVRQVDINDWPQPGPQYEVGGRLWGMTSHYPSGDVARKLMAIDQGERSEVLFWTGEKVGILGHGKTSRFAGLAADEGTRTDNEGNGSREEMEYDDMMRTALTRQADEVRFMQGLGLGM